MVSYREILQKVFDDCYGQLLRVIGCYICSDMVLSGYVV